jgi:hypothetical protein
VQVFASNDTLLCCADELDRTACKMQLVIDSRHRVLLIIDVFTTYLSIYPISVVGILDAGLQFHMIALAVSRKIRRGVFLLLSAVS